MFGTVDSWLLFKLTGRHVTDYSNASRTMLFDIRRLAWDEELCDLLGIDPRAAARAAALGRRLRHHRRVRRRGAVAGVAGDQQAALFGQACLRPGMAKNTYGTGSFVLLNAGPRAAAGAARGCSPPSPGGSARRSTYALEASIFVTGAAVQWLRDGLGIIDEAAETEALAASLDSNDGVYFVPALTGLGSPHWDPYARGTIVGLTRGSGRAHLARAALEAIAYQTVDAVRAQEAAAGERLDAAEGRRRRRRQPLADAVPGRRARRAGGGARGGRDDRARRRLPGRGGDRRLDVERVERMWRQAARYEPRMGERRARGAARGLARGAAASPPFGGFGAGGSRVTRAAG